MSTDWKRVLGDNLAAIRGRIAEAAAVSGRSAEDILLVAVTKYAEMPAVETLLELGIHDLGESRPQQLWERAEQLADREIRWHQIGHLQRNKVKRTVPLVGLVHSCDSLRLLVELDNAAAGLPAPLPFLFEVNISGEENKHGFHPSEVPALVSQLHLYPNLVARGLMAMAGLESGREGARREFAELRELRELVAGDAEPPHQIVELSMGMSGDFDVAIEEGATIIRLGSILFEESA